MGELTTEVFFKYTVEVSDSNDADDFLSKEEGKEALKQDLMLNDDEVKLHELTMDIDYPDSIEK